jgi:hypothetical protein
VQRVSHIARNHREAEAWDIEQYRRLTPAERQRIAKELRVRAYGKRCLDLRAWADTR